MTAYAPGWVKQDQKTAAVAVRLNADSDESATAWGIMHPENGGSYAPTSHVDSWSDRNSTPAEIPDSYPPGWVKQNTMTGAVALRRTSDTEASDAWAVMFTQPAVFVSGPWRGRRVSAGGGYAPTALVAEWEDRI